MGLATEPVVLEGTEIVRLTWELAGARGRPLLPSGLWPTSPTLLTVQALRSAGGAGGLGPFTVLTLMLSCRSGARARALVVAGAVDADDATADRLVQGWAFPAQRTAVVFERRYDATRLTVPGLVDAGAVDLHPLGVHDTQFVVALHPTTVDGAARYAQVDLEVEPDRAERGSAKLHWLRLDGADGRPLEPATAVAAVVAVGRLTLPRVRFLLDPEREPHVGTTVLA